jgi:hypothetical protein
MGKKFVKVFVYGREYKVLPKDIKKIYRTKLEQLPPIPNFKKTIKKKTSIDTDT